jgi:hypothetical protein
MNDDDAYLRLADRLTRRLGAAVERVTLEEFHGQEALYDEDSRSGRELLYLASNVEWLRGTRELVTLDAANSVETTVRVHVDLSRVAHEAFRDRIEVVWLPLLLLPPAAEAASATANQPVVESTGSPTPHVCDAGGAAVPSLPQSQARRWMAAALAEILLNMAPAQPSGPWSPRVVRREQRLLLSAAVYRVLREGGDGVEPVSTGTVAGNEGSSVIGRLEKARYELRDLVSGFSSVLRFALAGDTLPDERAVLLIKRAARILHAVSTPTTLVVVGIEPMSPSTVFSVRLPSTRLYGNRHALWRGSRAWVDLDLVLADGDADRSVEIQLPEGVSYSRLPGQHAVRAEVEVSPPRCLRHVGELMGQLERRIDSSHPDDPVPRCVADFTLARIDVARDVFRYHRLSAGRAFKAPLVEAVPTWMERLRSALRVAVQTPSQREWDVVNENWAQGRAEAVPSLFRNLEAEAVGPRTAQVRIPAIENRVVRTTPQHARVKLDIVVDESGPLHVARYSGMMSLVILLTVLVDLYLFGSKFDAQVLGGVLTLFAVIQASRIEHPDRLSLRGLLVSGGSRLILASILPTVLLGITLAFKDPLKDYPRAKGLTLAAVVVQALLLLVMSTDALPTRVRRWLPRQNRPPRLNLGTGATPDYERIDVLRSSWWRSATAGALLLGRPAHGYVVRQRGAGVSALLGSGQQPLPQAASNIARRGLTGLAKALGSAANGDSDGNGGRLGMTELMAAELMRRTQGRRDGEGPGLIDTPANILALLRAGTAQTSLTFVVFREKPEASWRREANAHRVDLDADQLTATEASVGNFDILLGLPPGRCPRLQEHPLTLVLGVVKTHRRLVLDVQLPCPAPRGGARERIWMRVRIGLRANEVATLAELLTTIGQTIEANFGDDVDLLIDMTSQTPPRRFLGTEIPPNQPSTPVAPSELDVMTRVSAGDPPGVWLIAAICGYTHNGVERDTLSQLAQQHPRLRLAGLATALLHGTSPMLVLAHLPDDADPSSPLPIESLGQDRPEADRAPLRLPQRQVVVEDWVSAATLGRSAVGTGLLLRVHTRCSDRPGTLSAVVEELGRGLSKVAGVRSGPSVPVWFIHTDVADGRLATSRLLVRLPKELAAAAASRATLDRVERVVQQALMHRLAPGVSPSERGEWIQARAVISIDVVTAHDADPIAPLDVVREQPDTVIDVDAAAPAETYAAQSHPVEPAG